MTSPKTTEGRKRMTIHKIAQIQRLLDRRIGTSRESLSIGVAHMNSYSIQEARQRAWSRIVELNLQTK